MDIYNRNKDGLLETIKFCGTPCTFNYVFWIDNDRFVVFGITEVTTPDGLEKCDIPDDWETCYDQLTVDFYDLSRNKTIRHLSTEHIFSDNPFSELNEEKWLESLSEEEKEYWQ